MSSEDDDGLVWCSRCQTTHHDGQHTEIPHGLPLPLGLNIDIAMRPCNATPSAMMLWLAVCATPFFVAMDGWVFKTIWNWNFSDVVIGTNRTWLPGLSWGQGVAVCLLTKIALMRLAEPAKYRTQDEADSEMIGTMVLHLCVLGLALFAGWFVA